MGVFSTVSFKGPPKNQLIWVPVHRGRMTLGKSLTLLTHQIGIKISARPDGFFKKSFELMYALVPC